MIGHFFYDEIGIQIIEKFNQRMNLIYSQSQLMSMDIYLFL